MLPGGGGMEQALKTGAGFGRMWEEGFWVGRVTLFLLPSSVHYYTHVCFCKVESQASHIRTVPLVKWWMSVFLWSKWPSDCVFSIFTSVLTLRHTFQHCGCLLILMIIWDYDNMRILRFCACAEECLWTLFPRVWRLLLRGVRSLFFWKLESK